MSEWEKRNKVVVGYVIIVVVVVVRAAANVVVIQKLQNYSCNFNVCVYGCGCWVASISECLCVCPCFWYG